MKTLLKQIRLYINESQAEFAERLGVTFATVNRWENGRAVPNKLAQLKIYEICKESNVPVYEFVLEKIKSAADSVKLEDGRILLFHGSKSGIEGKIAPLSRSQCDFGKGFYMGTEPAQALTLVCDYDNSKFYIISIGADELAHLEVPADIEWAMIVAYNRGRMENIKDSAFYNKYRDLTNDKDLIIGSIANDRMFFVIDNFFIGNITDAALVNSLSALEFGKQYVAVSQKGCDKVRIECEIQLSYLERLFIREVAEANRVKGVSFANDICKIYRREGRFFDEILDDVMKGESR